MPCKRTSWRPARAAGPDRSLNAALHSHATIKSPSRPALQHTSSTRGTQVTPTTSSCLRLGLNVAGSSCARMDWVAPKLLEGSAMRPEVNNHARPRSDLYDKHSAASLQCALTDSDTREDITATRHYNSSFIPFFPFPLASIKRRGGQPSQRLTNRTLVLRDLGSTPSPDQFVTPTTNNLSTGARQLDTGRRVLLIRGPNQYKSYCLLH
jgi:hypothetical protein